VTSRATKVAIIVIALTLGHSATINSVSHAAPSNGVSIRAVQNSAGVTAVIVGTNKKYASESIVVTSTLLQGKSTPKTSIVGSVSVGKNGTAVLISRSPLPKKATLSVFSGNNHLITVVDISIPIVTTLPKTSKAAVMSKSSTIKIIKAAVVRWRIEYDKSIEPTVESVPVLPEVLREALDSAIVTLNAYAAAGGDIKNQLAVDLNNAITARPPVIATITKAANAVREATTRLPAPLDPVALREAGDFAIKSLNEYLAAGGSNQDELAVALLGTLKVFPPVIADITAATNAVRAATNKLPPLVDPRQAAIEEVLRGLVVKAEALLDSYFAAGGSGEDDVVLVLLRALNADPQISGDIAEAMNALSFATTQLPTPDILLDVVGG
jgi:hypothetical protein